MRGNRRSTCRPVRPSGRDWGWRCEGPRCGWWHRHDRRWVAHETLRAHLPFVPGPSDRVLMMNAFAHGAALLAAAWFESRASVELIGGVDVGYADELFARRELTALCELLNVMRADPARDVQVSKGRR